MITLKSSSPLNEYTHLNTGKPYLVYPDLRLMYQVMNNKVRILSRIKPYLDCEVKCGCGRFHHHLTFKRARGGNYSCPGKLKCKGIYLKDGLTIR